VTGYFSIALADQWSGFLTVVLTVFDVVMSSLLVAALAMLTIEIKQELCEHYST